MAKELVVPLSSKGQVTLPKLLREFLHLEVGDYLRFEPKTGGVWLTKISFESEEFSDKEWKTLRRLAAQHGKARANAKTFLKDLDRL